MSLDCTPPPLPQYSKFTPGYRLKLEPIIYYQIPIEPTKQWRQYSIPPTTLEESAPQHHHRKSIHLVHGRRRASVFVLSGSRYGSEFVFSSKTSDRPVRRFVDQFKLYSFRSSNHSCLFFKSPTLCFPTCGSRRRDLHASSTRRSAMFSMSTKNNTDARLQQTRGPESSRPRCWLTFSTIGMHKAVLRRAKRRQRR